MFRMRSEQFLIGSKQESKNLIERVVQYYRGQDFTVTEYVRSNSFGFRENSFLGRKNKVEFSLRTFQRNDKVYGCIEYPNYLFMVTILLCLGLAIFFFYKCIMGDLGLWASLGIVLAFIAVLLGMQLVTGRFMIGSVQQKITSILMNS